jgi:hypothetical protein
MTTVEVSLDRLVIGAPAGPDARDAAPTAVAGTLAGAGVPLSAAQLSAVDEAIETAVRDAVGPPAR